MKHFAYKGFEFEYNYHFTNEIYAKFKISTNTINTLNTPLLFIREIGRSISEGTDSKSVSKNNKLKATLKL